MRRIGAWFGAAASAAMVMVSMAAGPAQAGYESDNDYWTGHGNAYTYVRGYTACGSGWKAWCKVYNVSNYSRDYGATYTRVAGNIDLSAGSGSLTLGWPPSISWTSSGYQCNFSDVRHASTWAKRYHDGTACRVESIWWTSMDDMATTGVHWKGSYSKSHTAWTSI